MADVRYSLCVWANRKEICVGTKFILWALDVPNDSPSPCVMWDTPIFSQFCVFVCLMLVGSVLTDKMWWCVPDRWR